MGKGSGGCVSRAALTLVSDANDDGAIEDGPGRSGRARETFRLLQAAGNFSTEYLLRDINRPNHTLSPEQVDAKDAAHNALMHWVPSSYHGHGGYVRDHEQLRQEIMYAIMLDGDRRSNHLYFYRDRGMNACWTLGSAAAARGWYHLPHDGEGNIVPRGLGQTIQAGMYHPNGSFLASLRREPIKTVAASIDVHEGGTSIESLAPRLAHTGQSCQRTVWRALVQADEDGVPTAPLRHLAIRSALDIADAEGCTDDERETLVQAAALMPGWNESVDSINAQASPAVVALLHELTPRRSKDDYPMLCPTTRLGHMLADAQQSWMASRWCDWGVYRWQQAHALPDSIETFDELRATIPRTPWWTKFGRDTYARPAKLQESRIRALIGLTRGGSKLPPAPKGWKRLQPADAIAA